MTPFGHEIEFGIPVAECLSPDVDGLSGDDNRLDVVVVELDEYLVEIFWGIAWKALMGNGGSRIA